MYQKTKARVQSVLFRKWGCGQVSLESSCCGGTAVFVLDVTVSSDQSGSFQWHHFHVQMDKSNIWISGVFSVKRRPVDGAAVISAQRSRQGHGSTMMTGILGPLGKQKREKGESVMTLQFEVTVNQLLAIILATGWKVPSVRWVLWLWG